jgi:hypothetical protein
MKTALIRTIAGIAILALISLFLVNSSMLAYTLIGHNLDLDQRDFRIWNNFSDATANDNTTADPDFGGHIGASLALMKGCVEWGSEPMGQSSWGDGGANFDAIFVGLTDKQGTTNQNIISEKDTYDGNVLAFTYPGGGGWKIRFVSDPWIWHDGPGNTQSGGNRFDIQGVGCHEYGHSLGLDHSSNTSATMYYATSVGNAQRTIETDDKNGLKAIYGAMSSSKPSISSISGGSTPGSALTINGSNFSSTNNEVWFTGDGVDGVAVKVVGVTSNGTVINVTVPSGVEAGMIAVKSNGSAHSNLSNCYPFGTAGGGSSPIPDIKANGTDTYLSVPSTTVVNITVSLDPQGEAGVAHDWWILADFNFGTSSFWWKLPGTWTKSATPVRAYSGPLINITNYSIAQSTLPVGIWVITFAVDDLNNVYEATYADAVTVQSY